jgi:hypothetical protein
VQRAGNCIWHCAAVVAVVPCGALPKYTRAENEHVSAHHSILELGCL